MTTITGNAPYEGGSSDPTKALNNLISTVDRLKSTIGDLNIMIDKLEKRVKNLNENLEMTTNKLEIREDMIDMFQEAREKGLWFWSNYQDIWFTPDELEAEQRNGRFRWTKDNWKLRDAKEKILEIDKKIEELQQERLRYVSSE